jgi:hypothetical protein
MVDDSYAAYSVGIVNLGRLKLFERNLLHSLAARQSKQ